MTTELRNLKHTCGCCGFFCLFIGDPWLGLANLFMALLISWLDDDF